MLINHTLMHQLKNCYDIRSTSICPEDAFLIGRAFGSQLIETNKKSAVIGYDRRKNSKEINDHFIEGMLSTGINIFALGRVPTPIIQLAEIELGVDASVAITASHNPPEYHGMKLFVNRWPFSDNSLAHLISRILQKNFHNGVGVLKNENFAPKYAQILSDKITIKGKFRIGIDLLNGSGADVFEYIAHILNGEYFILNHNLDYTFGGFAPDPTYEPRLDGLRNLIFEKKLDFGIVFDGDMDRCIILDNQGNMIPGDALLALFGYFLHKSEDQTIKIIWDSKSSNSFIKWAKTFSNSMISITGHSNIYNLLQQNKGNIGGECSGHYLFNTFYNISDGLYAALYLINNLEKLNLNLNEALDLLPTIWVAEAKSIKCPEDDKERIINQIANILSKQGVTLDLSDGVKAHLSCGWWMIRPSRTEEILRISAEGWTEDGLEKIKEHLATILATIDLNN